MVKFPTVSPSILQTKTTSSLWFILDYVFVWQFIVYVNFKITLNYS